MTASTNDLFQLAAGSYVQAKAALSHLMRRTPAQMAKDQAQAEEFLSGVEVTESTWAEWEDTTIDVREVTA